MGLWLVGVTAAAGGMLLQGCSRGADSGRLKPPVSIKAAEGRGPAAGASSSDEPSIPLPPKLANELSQRERQVVLRNGKQYQPPQRTPSAAVDHGAVSAGVDAMAGNARPAFDVRLPRTAVPADYTILFAVILAPFLTLPPAWWLWNLVRSIRLGEFRSPPRPHFHAH